jgi:hypothetical protein
MWLWMIVLLWKAVVPVLALTKVLVPSVYKEWTHAQPKWMTDPEILHKYNYSTFLYQKLDPSAPNYIAHNRGTEGGVFLKYIVDHYDNFPDVAMFVHAHPEDHQVQWLEYLGCINPNATYINLNFKNMYRNTLQW